MHGGHERNRGAGHVGHPVAPHAASDDDVVALDGAAAGDDGADLLLSVRRIGGLDIEHLGVREHLQHALVHRFVAEQGAGVERVDYRHGRAMEAAEDDVFVDERHERLDTLRCQHLGLDTPGLGAGHAASELVHALLRTGDLDAATVDTAVEVAVLVGTLHTKESHLLVVIDREDEVRRMAGAATGVRKRALVDEEDVLPSQAAQVADQAAADDAGADDDHIGLARKLAHACSLSVNCGARLARVPVGVSAPGRIL